MPNLKKLLQNQGENAGFNAKMFFKSHDLSKIIQFSLLLIPPILGIVSLSCGSIKTLDILAIVFSVFALVYFIYYGQNQDLYMEWGEKYLELYHEVESYSKTKTKISKLKIEEFKNSLSNLNKQNKPGYHLWAKKWVDKVMDKEMMYANEKKPWYK